MIAAPTLTRQHTYSVHTRDGSTEVSYRRDSPDGPVIVAVGSPRLLVNGIAVRTSVELTAPFDRNAWVNVERIRRSGPSLRMYDPVPDKSRQKAAALTGDVVGDVLAGRVTDDVEAAADAGFRALCARRLEWARERSYGRAKAVDAIQVWVEAIQEVDMMERAVSGVRLAECKRSVADLRERLMADLSAALDEVAVNVESPQHP